jgi:site-specific DNA-methyltransferase (adenine-specific)
VWSIPLSKFREAHFAVFPESLVETCILAGCPESGTVLDPFVGSGTVPVVASRLGRTYVGIDCVAEYCQMARRRLVAATAARQPSVNTKRLRPVRS